MGESRTNRHSREAKRNAEPGLPLAACLILLNLLVSAPCWLHTSSVTPRSYGLSPQPSSTELRRRILSAVTVVNSSVVGARNRSATVELGNTIVLAAVYGPHEVQKRSTLLHDRAVVTCDYTVAPFASGERRKRARGDRRYVTHSSLRIKQTCVYDR